MNQRIKEAVVRIAKTAENDNNALPMLENSLKPFLSCASAIYRGLSFMRRNLYKYGLLQASSRGGLQLGVFGYLGKSTWVFFSFQTLTVMECRLTCRLPVPVISVGNITWGGNGKTPMVETLSGWFLGAGICPLILTRGYAGRDEAQMLRMHFQGSCAKLGVGPNRAEIARSILQSHGMLSYQQRKKLGELLSLESSNTSPELWPKREGKVGIAILDDGMQHLPLARDLEIVMVNVITFWGNERMVPRGPLREPLQELKRADVLVLHHADLVTEERIQSIEDMLKQFVRKDSIVVCSSMTPQYLFRLPMLEPEAGNLPQTPERLRLPLKTLRDSVVLSVSGVGCPEALSLVLERLGAHYVDRMDYIDHHSFQTKDLDDIEWRCINLQQRFKDRTVILVLTEKDYVREPSMWKKISSVKVFILHSFLNVMSSGSALEALRKSLITVASSSVTEEAVGR